MTKIKICGIFQDEDTEYINRYRPDYFGMVIGFKSSHRNVEKQQAAHLRSLVSGDIPAVGVFVNENIDEVGELIKSGTIDIAQLHGSEDEAYIKELKERTGAPVWKAFRIRDIDDIERARQSLADFILLDNGYGTGETFDWSLISNIGRRFALAGGLKLENMRMAVETARPYMLDISSGVETNGKKDERKIKAAVALAHSLKGRINNV